MSKWQKVAELCDELNNVDDSLNTISNLSNYLKCVGHAPHIGERLWLFRYKGTLVVLYDILSGYWGFYSRATWLDYLIVKFGKKVK